MGKNNENPNLVCEKYSSYPASAVIFAMDASCHPYFLDLDEHVFQMTSCVQTTRTEWSGLHFSRFGYLSCTCIWHAWYVLWRAVLERLEQNSTVQCLAVP